VPREQLAPPLDRQRLTGERLGEALVGQGVISKFELAGSLAEQASLAEAPADEEAKPAEVVELAPRLEAVRDEEPGPGLVPPTELHPEPAFGTYVPEATDATDEPQPELEVAPQPEVAEEPGETQELVTATACVAFASTPRGYRLVDLENGAVPEVGKLVELPDVGELVVLRHGPSPLPADERICVYLEPLTPAAHA
jgi:hypothetical protein